MSSIPSQNAGVEIVRIDSPVARLSIGRPRLQSAGWPIGASATAKALAKRTPFGGRD
jgi:hypothetical protein